MNKVANFLKNVCDEHLNLLYDEADSFDKKGIVPDEAEIRNMAKNILGEDTVLTMTVINYNIYKEIAKRSLKINT